MNVHNASSSILLMRLGRSTQCEAPTLRSESSSPLACSSDPASILYQYRRAKWPDPADRSLLGVLLVILSPPSLSALMEVQSSNYITRRSLCISPLARSHDRSGMLVNFPGCAREAARVMQTLHHDPTTQCTQDFVVATLATSVNFPRIFS